MRIIQFNLLNFESSRVIPLNHLIELEQSLGIVLFLCFFEAVAIHLLSFTMPRFKSANHSKIFDGRLLGFQSPFHSLQFWH